MDQEEARASKVAAVTIAMAAAAMVLAAVATGITRTRVMRVADGAAVVFERGRIEPAPQHSFGCNSTSSNAQGKEKQRPEWACGACEFQSNLSERVACFRCQGVNLHQVSPIKM